MDIPIWQRFIGAFIYMLPWSDAIFPFGSSLLIELPFLNWLVLPALPLILVEQVLPFGGLLLFFILFLAIIRNPKIPYFIRFNTLQALLIDIVIILISYAFQIIIRPFGEGLIVRTFSSTVLVSILTIVIFSIVECFKGKEPDIPAISEAVRIQLF